MWTPARWRAVLCLARVCSTTWRVWQRRVAPRVRGVDVGDAVNDASAVATPLALPAMTSLVVPAPRGEHGVPAAVRDVCLVSRVVAARPLAAFSYSGAKLPPSLTAALVAGPCATSLRSLTLVATDSVVEEAARVVAAVGPRLTRLTLLTGLYDKDPDCPPLREPDYKPLSDYLVGVGPALTKLAVSVMVLVGYDCVE